MLDSLAALWLDGSATEKGHRSPEPMRSSRRTALLSTPTILIVPALSLVLAIVSAGTAAAQEGELQLKGLASVGYSHSFQSTFLDPGGSFSDGNGIDASVGFQAGEHVAFLVGWQWQGESDFDTHFIPVSIRGYSPPLLEDRVRLYGQFGLGLLFVQLHNEFNVDDNERASAVRLGLGAEVGITETLSAVVYSSYLWGLGSADDYNWGTVGVGLQYEWGL
jgi:hypothetical protein